MCWQSADYVHEGSPGTSAAGNRAAVSFSVRGQGPADGTYVPDSSTIGCRAHWSCGWEASDLIERVRDPRLPRRRAQVLDHYGRPALPETEGLCHTHGSITLVRFLRKFGSGRERGTVRREVRRW